MINLDEQELFRTYAQAKQLRIESLLDQYGSSLADVRELYPKLTETIEKQQLVTRLPTQALFFIPSEAAEMGLSLEEGWMLKISPFEGGYKSSLITPSKWEMTEDEIYISPAGEKYSKADLEALLAPPSGLGEGITGIPTVENLNEEGKGLYQEYQAAGGQLDVAGWIDLRENQQLETEQIFGAVFPEQDIDEVMTYIQENPEGFLADIRELGPTQEVISLLKSLEFQDEQGNAIHLTDQDIQDFFGTAIPQVVPPDMAQVRSLMPFPQTPIWATHTTALNTLGFPGAYGEIPTVEATPLEDAAYVFAGSIKYLPAQIGASILQAIQGQGGASVVNKDWADKWIAEANANLDEFVQKIKGEYPSSQFLLDVAQLSRNLGYSVTTMGIGNLAALPLWLAPEPTTLTKVGAAAVAGAVSGFVSFRMTTYQIMQAYLEFKNEEQVAQTGQGLTLDQENKLKADFHDAAVKYGLWEAVPEGISNMLFSGILGGAFNSALTKIAGQKAAQQIGSSLITRFGSKAFGIYGEELLTETITQKGQAAIEVEVGLREGNISWAQAFREIAPQTFLLTTIMAGAGQVIVSAGGRIKGRGNSVENIDKITNSLKDEIGEGNPLYEELKENIEEQIGKGTITEQDAKELLEAGLGEKLLNEIKIAQKITEPVIPTIPEIVTGQPYTATVFRGYKPGVAPTDEGLFGKGTYYTTSREYAETYDGKEVMTVTLRNPFVINSQAEAETFWNEHTRPVRQQALEEGKTVQEADELAAQAAREWLESQGYDGLVARNIIEQGDEIVVFEPKKTVGPRVPVTEAGMPEAGLQAGIPGMAAAEVVRPQPTGKLVQARIDDYLRLREYNAKAVTDRIAEIKKALEKKGRTELGLRGTLALELARLEAQQELEAIETIQELDALIKEVEDELGLRSLPFQGYGGKSHIDLMRHPSKRAFKGYTTRQLEEMRNVYLQAREKIEPAIASVKAEDIPSDMPALTNTQLTPTQVEKTIDLFKQAVIAPNTEMQRAAAIELRKHVLAQRAKSASESAEAMIVEGANPEEAIKMAEQMFMSGKLPDVTTDYFDDLTQEMRNVLFAKVYNYWKDKSWFELISTFDALTNTLAGRSIPRVKGIGSKYFPNGGSAWDRLARVFVGDIEVLNALDQGKSLRDVIQGVLLESGRGSIPLSQETVAWLKELSTISEEDKLLLTKPLSELTETDVRRIATSWFWSRQNELNTLLAAATITRSEYQLELAIAKDRVFPHKPMQPANSYPTGPIGQPRLGEAYTPVAGIPETRTAEELRLAKWKLEKKLREATTEPTVTPPPSEWAKYNEAFKELPLLTLREKGTIIRTLKTLGMTAVDIGNFVRANKASCDMSAWRQVMPLVPGNPVAAYRSEVEAWKALFSQASAEANWQWVKRQPSFPYYAEMVRQTGQDFLRMLEAPKGTAQWQAAEEFGYLTEERLLPRITAKLPWIKWSGRAFVVKTNTMAIMVYNKRLEVALARADMIATGKIKLPEGEGFSIQAEMNDFGRAIAWMTQRASLGKLKAIAPEISAMVFAPRSWAGRFLMPKLLIDSNPRVRAFAWKNLSLDVTVIGGLVMLGYSLGLWDYEDDPRSGEFGSIRIGNLRIDPWAGYRQFLVLYTRLITGTGVSSVTGQEYEVNPIGALTTFFRNALSPLASTLLDLISGKNFLGEKVDIANPMQWVDRVAPFTVQTVLEAYQDSWQHGVIAFLPAFFGAGVSTYSGDWKDNWAKMGLPKYPENTGYGIYEPIYDLADFWADTASQFKGVDPATLTASKGFPEYVRSIAQALQIIETIETLPNKKLTSFNADPEKGTTFMQYYQMWQDRQKIVASGDTEKLKAFDADERTRNAYLGNITQAQYALLVEYHSLPETEKADFLGNHPELYINPREEWLRTHPQENALLALWGKADVYTSEALSQISTLTKQLDIPENALVMKDLDAVSELKLKNQSLFDLVDAYGGLDDTLKGPDGLTARDRAIKQLYLDNPDFREDQRRIEALNVGTKDNPTIESMVEGWVERGKIADEFGSSSPEMKLWLIDNKEVHQWALENGLLSDTGEDWNENILRLQVNYREGFDKYDNYGDITSPLYISNDTARADAREAMLFDTKGMTSFGVAHYTIDALQKNMPENLVTTYVDYYGIRKKENVDYSKTGWYDDDWYLIEHPDFYDTMISLKEWQEKDFAKVPTREVFKLYQTYYTQAEGEARVNFRIQHPELDAWLVYAKKYTFHSDAAREIYSNQPEKFLAYWPR